ncbi:Endoplasmic reticulum-Golgi intermediate compartment protein 3 [Cichlidogyrus casuarinus]|uniref:Endoplasmic reticulum-Golgi intermediate compartment protein 3 n=1 Tax=Cichlidogyrus casuarinus TaxID=1844966 RepID=A0ABD2Q4Q4_9PLAT
MQILIDATKNDRLEINIDITMPKLSCDVLSLDTIDVSGKSQYDIRHSVHKISLDESGKEISPPMKHLVNAATKANDTEENCGSCYGAQSEGRKCCNTCQDVLDAYKDKGWATVDLSSFKQCIKEGRNKKGGCRFIGSVEVNKVAGSFHITPGQTMEFLNTHVHDLSNLNLEEFDFQHRIDRLVFGAPYPGLVSPLSGTHSTYNVTSPSQFYFLKLVPTIYSNEDQSSLASYQYSVTSLQKSTRYSRNLMSKQKEEGSGDAGIFFQYEISPVLVRISSERRSFLHFLVNTCAIIGGIYTVASMIDALLYRSSCFFVKID